MFKQTKLIIFILICSACDMTRIYYPATVITPQPDRIFVDICTQDPTLGIDKCQPLNVPNIDLYENAKTGLSVVPLDYMNVYQDIDRQNLLHSYTRTELLNKKRQAGFRPSAKNTFLIITKDDIVFTNQYQASNK